MQLLKLTRKTSSKSEMAQAVLKVYTQVKGVKLSKSQEQVMSYLMVYGISKDTKDLIIKSGILKSVDSVANALTQLKKKGLLTREYDSHDIMVYKVIKELNITLDPVMGILIKYDNR